ATPSSNPKGDDDNKSDCDKETGGSPSSPHPVNLATGVKQERVVDFTVPAVGQEFQFTREYSSSPGLGGAELLGKGWMASAFRYVHVQEPAVYPSYIVHMTGPPVEKDLVFTKDGAANRWLAGGPT